MKLSELVKKEILSLNGSSRIVYATDNQNLVLKETNKEIIGRVI